MDAVPLYHFQSLRALMSEHAGCKEYRPLEKKSSLRNRTLRQNKKSSVWSSKLYRVLFWLSCGCALLIVQGNHWAKWMCPPGAWVSLLLPDHNPIICDPRIPCPMTLSPLLCRSLLEVYPSKKEGIAKEGQLFAKGGQNLNIGLKSL